MPTIYSVMDISRWALHAATRQLDTVSHNVANVNTEGYSRQEVVQATRFPEKTNEGWYGRGVEVTTVVQQVDKLLLERITDKLSLQEYNDARLQQLERLETFSNEAGDSSLGSDITAFFSAWQDLSNNPESSAVRETLREAAENLVNRFQTINDDINQVQRDLDTYISGAVTEANDICRRVAELNGQIQIGEAANQPVNDLRDERVVQLNELAKLMNIDWFEDSSGAVTVLTSGGKTLVQSTYPVGDDVDPLSYTNVDGYSNYQLVANTVGLVLDSDEVSGGNIGAWLEVRDSDIPDMEDYLNDLANTVIAEVNSQHSQGVGLSKFTDVTGSYKPADSTTAFSSSSNSSTMPYYDEVTSGSFTLWVYENNTRRSYDISVSASDTLTTLAARINDTINPTQDKTVNPVASVNSDGEFDLSAEAGIEFGFANDTSNVLMALGINTFFDGNSATNMSLNSMISSDVNYIAAGRILSDGEHAQGDNSNALDIADLKDAQTMSSGSETFNESVISWASGLGTKVATAQDSLDFAETATNELQDLRDNVSAVSLDEEMVKMIRYQRAYQMAARMISVADSLFSTLLELKR